MSEVFKTVMQMVRIIVETSKDKEEALKRIDDLAILKNTGKGTEASNE